MRPTWRARLRPGDAEQRWTMAAALLVAAIAVLYVVLADRAEHPMAVFLLPVLAAAALLSWRRTAAIGALALAVAAVEGHLASRMPAAAYWSRLVVIVSGTALAVTAAAQRTHRERQLDRARVRAVLSDAFQSSLVPRPLPPPHVTVGSRCRPGDDRLQLGGDFFDALELRDGSLGYIIGDVCGHGPNAAALGAAIRAGWKTIANRQPADPVAWLTALEDAFFRYGRHDEFVTVNTGRIGVGERRLRYVSAGHPWPVLLDGGAQLLRPAVGPPLGVVARASWTVSELDLEPGATLLLYTDGLIENDPVGRRAVEGERALLAHLQALAPGAPLDLDELLERFGPQGFNDDVAVLTIALASSHQPVGPG